MTVRCALETTPNKLRGRDRLIGSVKSVGHACVLVTPLAPLCGSPQRPSSPTRYVQLKEFQKYNISYLTVTAADNPTWRPLTFIHKYLARNKALGLHFEMQQTTYTIHCGLQTVLNLLQNIFLFETRRDGISGRS